MRIIALDDEQLALNVIENYCKRLETVTFFKAFTSTFEALNFLDKNPVDVILLDIQMPSISGMELARKIDPSIQVIFTTAYEQHALEAFDIQATDYLLKPIHFDRFEKAIQRAQENLHSRLSQPESTISLKQDYGIVNLEIQKIDYIEAYDDYIKIHLEEGPVKVIRSTMKSIYSRLPENEFMRIHKSFIVAKNKVSMIKNKKVMIKNKELPIGASYFLDVKESIQA